MYGGSDGQDDVPPSLAGVDHYRQSASNICSLVGPASAPGAVVSSFGRSRSWIDRDSGTLICPPLIGFLRSAWLARCLRRAGGPGHRDPSGGKMRVSPVCLLTWGSTAQTRYGRAPYTASVCRLISRCVGRRCFEGVRPSRSSGFPATRKSFCLPRELATVHTPVQDIPTLAPVPWFVENAGPAWSGQTATCRIVASTIQIICRFRVPARPCADRNASS